MLRIRAGERRSFFEYTLLAFILSLVAGAVNASGLLAAGAMTSHMTGNLTRLGEGIALGRIDALQPACFVLFFLGGAFAATVCTMTLARRWLREPVPVLLLIEAAMLTAVAQAAWLSSHPLLLPEILCFAMGWQNALITKISGAVVRTTHMTGTTTDLGIELGHLAVNRPRLFGELRSKGLVGFVREVPPDSDLARAAMHLTAICCFMVGATIGPLLFVRYGYPAMIGPAAVLVALVIGDLAFRAAHPPVTTT